MPKSKLYVELNCIYWINDNGLHHREDGPAVEYPNGNKQWYLNGKLHREDGPAIDYGNANKQWYLNGKLHREDGPALEYPNGIKYWVLNDVEFTEEDYNAKNKNLRLS